MSPEPTKILLLPGMEGSGLFFRPLLEHLGPEWEPEVMSYPQDRPAMYPELAEEVAARFPGRGPYIILGESYGGPLALMASSMASGNLLGVVLVATFITSPVPRWLRWSAGALCRPLLAMRPKKTLMGLFLADGCPGKTVGWVHANMPELPPEVICSRLRDVFAVDAAGELAGCPVPILYIKPDRDRLVREGSLKEILALRPDATVKRIDAPHMVLQCAPEKSAAAIAGWAAAL